ncbi:hypothetical protein [Pontiella sp.]|uniref:hypothetical protein n=2 Tax=Pontiella sp. TaxID=2837462 RepID=UPI003569DC17
MMIRRLAAVLMVSVLLAGAGCVSKQVEPEHKPQLGVSQNADGIITISLNTEVGYIYTILYQDPQDQRWKVLSDCKALRGTGKTLEIQKRVDPRKPVPALTVDYVKLK